MKRHTRITRKMMRSLPKVQTHEHLDCSVRPLTLLEYWDELGFNSKLPFPKSVLDLWRAAQILKTKGGADAADLVNKLENMAAAEYQRYLVKFASASLANYVQAIVDHVLPVMQSPTNLYRITKQRIQDAINDGHI